MIALNLVSLLLPPTTAYPNGGYSADPSNPDYGTHDWIAEHAVDWLPDDQKQYILTTSRIASTAQSSRTTAALRTASATPGTKHPQTNHNNARTLIYSDQLLNLMAEITFPDHFTRTANDIRTMRIRGAGRIARTAAKAMKDLVDSYEDDDLKEFRSYLNEGAKHLLNTRPTAISLKNSLRLTLGKAKGKTVKDLRKTLSKRADEFIDRSRKAVATIGLHGSKMIRHNDSLLTHCNSAASTSVLVQAHSQGKKIRVFATETRPWNQGHLTVTQLAKEGVNVTLIVDSAVRFIIKDENINAVFVGADTIHSDGSLVNKIGTSQIALIANEANIPFYVCAETYKFSPDSLRGELAKIEERDPSEIADTDDFPNVSFRNPVFDMTPAKYVTAIVTEKGVISPHAAYGIIEEEFEDVEEWIS